MRLTLFLLLFISVSHLHAQLGFCEGSKGDPIFHEDFGTGTSTGPALSPSITNYTYVNGDPNDGQYTISDRVGQNNTTWHPSFPNSTISNGRALIVNASYTSGQFYRTKITGLCQNTTYEFSAYLINVYDPQSGVCDNGGIPVNVRFEIWDETEAVLLKEGSTGNITSTSSPQWKQFALTFQSEAGQESVILKMFNNGEGGCGNDLAIDDIVFRSCGDLTEVRDENTDSTSLEVCEEDSPVQVRLKATSDSSVYSTHFYQWQKSADGTTWVDISGETGESYISPALTASTYYRVKVAEDKANLLNNLCSSASEAFFVHILQTPDSPKSTGDISICDNRTFPPLTVEAEADESVNWYDAASGGNILAEDSPTLYVQTAGTYYAEAIKKGFSCKPGGRTAVTLTILPAPETQDETLYLCEGSTLSIDAGVSNMAYSWSTGAIFQTVVVSTGGLYSVDINSSNGCSTTKTIEVIIQKTPVISEILSEAGRVEIVLEETGDFEYSLDGVEYQSSNVFNYASGGIYTVHVRNRKGCSIVTRQFAHLVYPEFITPNNDGHHDLFELKGLSFFGPSEIRIFDRYGRLLKLETGEAFQWNGTFNGNPLPADDYWFEVRIEGLSTITGHFSLIR